MEDSLHKVEVDSKLWIDIMEAFKSDWYRGITGYYALDVLGKWIKLGADYGFRILSPFGDAKNGFLAVIKDEKDFIEMLMECPQDDTSSFGEALKKSNVIDWDKNIIVLFPRSHIYECMKKIAPELNVEMEWVHYLHCYVLDKSSPLFDVSLPEDMKFDLLTEDIIPLVDSTWPHRYPGSEKYFQLLIKTKSGYGIYRNKQLVAFGFIKEMGALGHIYTLEEHRRKGYGEIVTKLICNVLLKEKRGVFSFCVEGNEQSCKMHEKIGFFRESTVYSFGIKRKISNMAIV